MAWQDDLKPAAYISPNGNRIEFTYEAVSWETQKRTAAFSFAGVDGNYIQDNGFGAAVYPMRCIFWGDNYHVAAAAFQDALLARGVGKLEHPLYGTFDVVPFGRLARRDDLKTLANQAIFEVAFWTTTKIVYPENQLDAASELNAGITQFVELSAGEQFAAKIDISTQLAKANLADRTEAVLTGAQAALGGIASTTTDVNNAFRDLQDAINFSIDILVGQPLLLAEQISNLISLPARASAGVADRIVGYSDFAQGIFGSQAGRPWEAQGAGLPRNATNIANDFHTSDLSAAGAVNGAMLSVLENQFTTRPDAVSAAVAVLALFDAWVAWRQQGFDFLQTIDPGDTYQRLQANAALVSGFLVEISFTLLTERSLVLVRNRTIVDLAGELYGNTSNDTLNLLINTNALTGSEIIELPKGREIVYYA